MQRKKLGNTRAHLTWQQQQQQRQHQKASAHPLHISCCLLLPCGLKDPHLLPFQCSWRIMCALRALPGGANTKYCVQPEPSAVLAVRAAFRADPVDASSEISTMSAVLCNETAGAAPSNHWDGNKAWYSRCPCIRYQHDVHSSSFPGSKLQGHNRKLTPREQEAWMFNLPVWH